MPLPIKGFFFIFVNIYDLGTLAGLVLILVFGLDLVLIKLFGRLFDIKWSHKNYWSGIYTPQVYVLSALYLKCPNSGVTFVEINLKQKIVYSVEA